MAKPDFNPAPEVVIWTSAAQAVRVGDVLELMGASVKPLAVGGPGKPAEVVRLGERLDCPAGDDLRHLLVNHPSAFVVLATMQGVTPQHLATAAEQDSVVLGFEPLRSELAPEQVAALHSGGAPASGKQSKPLKWVRVPDFQVSPGWHSAADPEQLIGDVLQARFTSTGREGDGSLFSRLIDAWELILRFVPLPETIDATLTGTGGSVPDDLRKLTGHLGVMARTRHAGVTMQLSDRSGDTRRVLDVIGEQGHLRVDDLDYVLHDLGGSKLDERTADQRHRTTPDLIATQWKRIVDQPERIKPTPQPADGKALACALTCVLSARTGEAEEPLQVVQMHRMG